MFTDKTLQRYTIMLPVALAQSVHVIFINANHVMHIVVNTHINEVEQRTVRPVQGVIKIEQDRFHPLRFRLWKLATKHLNCRTSHIECSRFVILHLQFTTSEVIGNHTLCVPR